MKYLRIHINFYQNLFINESVRKNFLKFSYRRKDVRTERRSFFVRCRRTYVLNNYIFENVFWRGGKSDDVKHNYLNISDILFVCGVMYIYYLRHFGVCITYKCWQYLRPLGRYSLKILYYLLTISAHRILG